MRHTVHLLMGSGLERASIDLKKYGAKYGEDKAKPYFNVINWDFSDNKWVAKIITEKIISDNTEFISEIDERYQVLSSHPQSVDNDEEVKHYFASLYDNTITINNQGDSVKLHLCIYLPLYKENLWKEAKRIIEQIGAIRQSYSIDIIGFAADLDFLFCKKEDLERLPFSYEEHLNSVKTVSKEIVAFKSQSLHRFILIQNCNSQGVALNLDHESFIRIIGEFSLLCVENYATLFPQSQEFDREDITAFGFSVLNLDKFYFVNYLLRRAYLHVLERENVTQKEVDVNRMSEIVQKQLSGHTNLFSEFYIEEVEPLIKKGKSHVQIITEITPKLDKKIEELTEDFQSFIKDEALSLPEKQAAMAQLLGEDDELLKGNQFNKDQLILDDCYSEALGIYIEENNRHVKEEKNKNGEITYIPAVLETPHDEFGKIYLPLDGMKYLRSTMRESTNYIRQKSKELESQSLQLENEEQSKKRLIDGGFTYGHTIYKLQEGIEEKPLQETYEPQGTLKNNVDMRNNFTPIKDQGQLGACTVFAISSIYEYILKKSKQKNYDLSERFVYYNVRTKDGSIEDKGSSVYDVIESLEQEGICLEDFCPYNIDNYYKKPNIEAYEDAKNHIIKKAENVKIKHLDFVSALSDGYPIAISLKIYNSFGNNYSGFVFRPTDEEIESKSCGNHSMVICGYSEDDKVYIVRNSWGKEFGECGYCYIPFSYIEDEQFINSACIITSINNDEETKGIQEHTVVSFNKTDANIRYSIIRVLIDEEKQLLAKRNKDYAELRSGYEQLVQTLGNNSKRSKIYELGNNRLINEEKEIQKEQKDFIDKERPKALEDFQNKSNARYILYGGFITFIALIWGFCCYFIENWYANDWNWILMSLTGITAVLLSLYISQRKHYFRKLKEELDEIYKGKEVQIRKKREEQYVIQLRFHIAGMIIDRLSLLQNELAQKYLAIKSYEANLSAWYNEESRKLEKMDSIIKNPFIPLLSNSILDKYFDDNKDDITSNIHLYEYLNGYKLDNDTIRQYKVKIRNIMIDKLLAGLDNFTVYNHINNKTIYPYLDKEYASIEKLLPLLDAKSDYFLQTQFSSVSAQPTLSRLIFIHTDQQNEKTEWNQNYPKYFQTKPIAENFESVFKLVVVQKCDIKAKDVKILN